MKRVPRKGSEPDFDRSPERPSPPAAPLASEVLGLQRQAGNRAVSNLLARYHSGTPRPPARAPVFQNPDYLAAKQQAGVLNGAAMRALHVLLGLRPAADYRQSTFDAVNALRPAPATPGMLDDGVLETLLKLAVGRGMHAQIARLVDTRPIDLSVRFDPNLKTAHQSVSQGGLPIVRLGPSAFASVRALRAALDAAIPIVNITHKNAKQRLNAQQLVEATVTNPMHVPDLRSGVIIADAIGGGDSDPASEEFAEWIADFQARSRLSVSGQVNYSTFRKIVERIQGMGWYDAVIRLVLDRFKLQNDWIADVRFNPRLKDDFVIDRGKPGPVTIDFGPNAFRHGLPALVNAVADASKQASAQGHGQTSPGQGFTVQEQMMLGKAERLIGAELPKEPAKVFNAEIADFLNYWRPLTADQRKRSLATLKSVAGIVERRSPKSPQVAELKKEITRAVEDSRWHESK